MNSKLPLGIRYWYMKEALEFGWSRNILSVQIESGLFQRQMKAGKVNNFTKTLPDVQSDLANYLFKDPYIFDAMGIKDRADERDIETQLVDHVTKYLLEMGTGFAFVARQKHFQHPPSKKWSTNYLNCLRHYRLRMPISGIESWTPKPLYLDLSKATKKPKSPTRPSIKPIE